MRCVHTTSLKMILFSAETWEMQFCASIGQDAFCISKASQWSSGIRNVAAKEQLARDFSKADSCSEAILPRVIQASRNLTDLKPLLHNSVWEETQCIYISMYFKERILPPPPPPLGNCLVSHRVENGRVSSCSSAQLLSQLLRPEALPIDWPVQTIARFLEGTACRWYEFMDELLDKQKDEDLPPNVGEAMQEWAGPVGARRQPKSL